MHSIIISIAIFLIILHIILVKLEVQFYNNLSYNTKLYIYLFLYCGLILSMWYFCGFV